MAISFQYNKTSMQELKKQLNVRIRALPTLQNKEAALRLEVARARKESQILDENLRLRLEALQHLHRLWAEFDADILTIKDVKTSVKKFAGVKIPILDEVIFDLKPFSIFNCPSWYMDGIALLKELIKQIINYNFTMHKTTLLEFARKKTTQKVNLYEKVQIPGYEDAIRKIKRYLEDVENLSKSAQKIVKKRQEVKEVAS